MTISKFLNPKNDVAFKKLFGTEKHKEIVIHFINDVLDLKGKNKIKTVEFLTPIQDPEIASKKQSIVDVLCKDENDVQIIVEMQVAPTRGFEKRAQYYAAKTYSRQLDKGGKYNSLKEIVFIAISDCIVFPNKEEYKSDHVILDKSTYEHDLKDFSFTFIELPKFRIKDINLLTSILEKWCFFFKYADETTEAELERLIGSDTVIKVAYEALNQFNWTEKELIAYEEEIKRVMDNEAAMDYQYEKGKVEGIEKGKAEERAKAKEEKVSMVKILLSQGVDASVISRATGITIDEINKMKN